MKMTVHPAPQGSAEWAEDRANRYNAGDAAAMLGCDPNGRTRTDLLDEMVNGFGPDVCAFKQRLYDKGHEVEAMTRPLAEGIVGEDLYPLVGSIEVPGLSRRVGASFDGLTMARIDVFECKSLNEALAAALPVEDDPDANDAAQLAKGYRVQMEQQLMVSGAERVLFCAAAFHPDGTTKSLRACWYRCDPALRAEILAGWQQLDVDRATHVPTEVAEMPKAEVTIALPALFIHARGEITTSNMKEYGIALAARLEQIRSIQLLTDQDFSNAKESAKLLRENIESARLAKDAMLAQTVTVGEAARMIDAWCEDMRLTALQLEKDVEREDKAKKAAMIDAAKVKYAQHVQELDREIAPARITLPVPVFAEAIKNKRNFASMQDALDTMLATAKIAANEVATTIRFNREQLRPQNGVDGEDWISLFPDFAAVCAKPRDDFHNLVTARVAAHRQRLEAERERIRKEEQEKLQQAADRAQRELEQQHAAQRAAGEYPTYGEAVAAHDAGVALQTRRLPADAWRFLPPNEEMDAHCYYRRAPAEARQSAPAASTTQPLAPVATAAPALSSQAANVVPMGTRKPTTAPSLTLGQINDRLGRGKWSEADLTALGFPPAATRQNTKPYHDADFGRMVDSIVAHLRTVQAIQAQQAA